MQMNSKVNNESPGSTFKMPSRTKSPIRIKLCNTQRSTKPPTKIYSIESVESDTKCVVVILNLEEGLKNYNT